MLNKYVKKFFSENSGENAGSYRAGGLSQIA